VRIFTRIFLSFWLSTVLAIAVSIGTVMFRGSDIALEVSRSIPTGELERCAKEVARRYQLDDKSQASQPIEGCKIDFIIDSSNHDIFSRKIPANLQYLVVQARTTGNMQVAPLPGLTVVTIPVKSATAQALVVVFAMSATPPHAVAALFWQVAPFAAAAALICYFLTGYILTPLKRLGNVADELGGGDLSTRADADLDRRRDEFGDLARTFNRMADRIESLVNNQRMFLAHISHELGSPLTRLGMTLAIARRKANVELTPELDRMERESIELNQLVQQLLLLARLQSGTELSDVPVVFRVSGLVLDVEDNAAFEANQMGRSVNITRYEDFAVKGHRELLKRALDNVIRNALRFTPVGSSIEIEFFSTNDRSIGFINILDRGPGVEPSKLDNIFEPFSSSGASGGHSGVGLGLAIARHAVLAHEGQISAQNRAEGGLMITIELPVQAR
jgi:two-component system sensor histidine kinase CpxA